MLSLNPGSVCDVCREEYSPTFLPNCIPCGHVLCATCCSTIIEKTPSRLSPVCPFCRVVFTSDAVRKIRIDFTSSGRSTPRVGTIEAPAHAAFPRGVIAEDRLPPSEKDRARLRIEARRLEDKVAKAAAKKCSVEEVAALQHEVDDWLRASDSSEEQPTSLLLSSALLRAILANYHAHADSTKSMKSAEANLKAQVDELESAAGNLQGELRKLKAQQAQKAQEIQTLRVELNRYKIKAAAATLSMPASSSATSFGSAGASTASDSRPTSPISPSVSDPRYSSQASSRATSPLTSPTLRSASPATSPMHSPTSSPGYVPTPRYTSSTVSSSSTAMPAGHYRPSSTAPYRPTTPAAPRSGAPTTPTHRSHTPAAYPTLDRPTTPTPPTRSSSTRRMSVSSRAVPAVPAPPKMMRSASEEERERERARESERAHLAKEKAQQTERHQYLLHQRWLPSSHDPRSPSAPPAVGSVRSGHSKSSSMSGYAKTSSPLAPPSSRTVSAANAMLPQRYGTPLRA